MLNNKIIQIVASESTPEKEAAFNKWYTEVHVPMLFAYEGVKQASRYQRIGDDEQGAKFLAIYEFETKEAMEAFPESDAFADAIEDFENNKEALGFKAKWVASYELLRSYEK
jgi:heme-degrading monooxygenase HmoA